MKTRFFLIGIFATVAFPALAHFAMAADLPNAASAPATDAATELTDTSRHTLFDPTPADSLRGMDTDRPNKTNTPHTIDAGHFQIEAGIVDYAYYRDKYRGADSRTDLFNLGQFNFRLGVLDNIEINAVIDSEELLRETDYTARQSSRENGLGDTVIGGKMNFWGNQGSDATWACALGIQPEFKIPTARENLGNGHPELFVGLPFLINLPAELHLGLQPTLSWERNSTNNGEVTGWQNSASVDRVFLGRYDVYVEYWDHITSESHLETQQTIDCGVTVQLSDNLILDMAFNFGLNKASTTLECLLGVSVRF